MLLSCLGALRAFFQTRADIALEILALRQQLAVLKRKRPGPNWTGWTGSFGLPSAVAGPVGPRFSSLSSPKPSSAGIALGSASTGVGALGQAEAGLRSTKRFAPSSVVWPRKTRLGAHPRFTVSCRNRA